MFTKGLLISCIVAVVCVVGGILTLGLPGALLFEIGTPLLRLVFGAGALDSLPPDSYWPIAIIMTLLWPASIVAGHLIAFRLLRSSAPALQVGAFMLVLFAWDVVLAGACYLLGASSV